MYASCFKKLYEGRVKKAKPTIELLNYPILRGRRPSRVVHLCQRSVGVGELIPSAYFDSSTQLVAHWMAHLRLKALMDRCLHNHHQLRPLTCLRNSPKIE